MKIVSLLLITLSLSFSLLAAENASLSKAQEDLKKVPYWTYPYPQVINYLREKDEKSILIFSYGSLMDASSAARTLSPASMITRRAGAAFGIRRLFDRDVPIRKDSDWCIPIDSNARGMLNVMLSDEPQDFVNGVLVDVVLEDIPKLLFREKEYDLLPVVVQEWDNVPTRYLIAYTFYAPQNTHATNATLLPRPGYYELARNASLLYGQTFYKIWLKTTYFADGVTPITEWEKKILLGDEQTKFRCLNN